eukprot:GFYU01019518.1.p1 GENE.GFYU01019518.1~~GFYU01019518.1.p1  ORF type:complete len:797 (-),score=134.38 GFYU01019518.1:51-2246(-)
MKSEEMLQMSDRKRMALEAKMKVAPSNIKREIASRRVEYRERRRIYTTALLSQTGTVPIGLFFKKLTVDVRSNNSLSECFYHLVFFTFFMLAVYENRNIGYSNDIKTALDAVVNPTIKIGNSFVPVLSTVKNTQDLYNYMGTTLADAIYPEKDWFGNALPEEKKKFVAQENRRIGPVRFRQVRVKSGDCASTDPSFLPKGEYTCYPKYYVLEGEDQTFYGKVTKRAYDFTSVLDSAGVTTYGYIDTYPGSGYLIDMPMDNNGFKLGVEQLKLDNWISQATRLVTVTFPLHNSHLNVLAVPAIVIEYDVAGGMHVSVDYKSMYIRDLSRAAMENVYEFIFFVWLFRDLIYLARNAYRGKQLKKSFSKWIADHPQASLEALDLVVCGVALIIRGMFVYRPGVISFDLDTKEYYRAEYTLWMHSLSYNLHGLNIVFGILRIFNYLRINPRLYMLFKALSYASLNGFAFVGLWTVVFLTFSFIGHLVFGPNLLIFSTMQLSMQTIAAMMIGSPIEIYNYVQVANPTFAPIFFTMFVAITSYVMGSICFSILSESYTRVRVNAPANMASIMHQSYKGLVRVKRELLARRKGERFLPAEELKDTLIEAGFDGMPTVPETELMRMLSDSVPQAQIAFIIKKSKKLEVSEAREIENLEILDEILSEYDEEVEAGDPQVVIEALADEIEFQKAEMVRLIKYCNKISTIHSMHVKKVGRIHVMLNNTMDYIATGVKANKFQ